MATGKIKTTKATKSEVSSTVELDLRGVPRADRASVKSDVGDFLVNQILERVADGESPVEGRGSFRALSSDYKKAKEASGAGTDPTWRTQETCSTPSTSSPRETL